MLVNNANRHHLEVLLLGDALHTAHFSIGSATGPHNISSANILSKGFSVSHSTVFSGMKPGQSNRPRFDRLCLRSLKVFDSEFVDRYLRRQRENPG